MRRSGVGGCRGWLMGIVGRRRRRFMGIVGFGGSPVGFGWRPMSVAVPSMAIGGTGLGSRSRSVDGFPVAGGFVVVGIFLRGRLSSFGQIHGTGGQPQGATT